MNGLDGSIAIVTGAGRGIGFAVARDLASRGACVVGVGSSRQVEDSVARLPGSDHMAVRADLSDPDAARHVVNRVVTERGTPQILVNSAGISKVGPASEVPSEDWRAVMDVNLGGTFFMAREAARTMIEAGYGRIVNLGSQAGVVGLEDHATYCASKAAVSGLTRVLAAEWGPQGITVNTVSPTIVATDMGAMAWSGAKGDDARSRIPAGRFADPEEVAAMVGYVVSPEAGMVNGADLLIDGGYSSV